MHRHKLISSLWFFADISRKSQKWHNLWQFKYHNSERRHENQTNGPFIFFSRPNCFGNPFLHLKIVKISFHGIPSPFGPFWYAKPLILEVKAAKLGFCPIRFRKHILESKKPDLNFCIELRINSKIFRGISWSPVTANFSSLNRLILVFMKSAKTKKK